MKRFRWTWFLWHHTPGPVGFQIPGATPPTVPLPSPPTFDKAPKSPDEDRQGHS